MMRPTVVYGKNYLEKTFDDFFKDVFCNTGNHILEAPIRTDIKESDEAFEIDMDLPGFATEDVKAELKDGYLTISASHTEEKEEKVGEKDEENDEAKDEEKDNGVHYIRKERFSGSYRRSFYVGDAVTQDDIKAKYTDGVLSVTVPKIEKKPEEEEKQYIPIEG